MAQGRAARLEYNGDDLALVGHWTLDGIDVNAAVLHRAQKYERVERRPQDWHKDAAGRCSRALEAADRDQLRFRQTDRGDRAFGRPASASQTCCEPGRRSASVVELFDNFRIA